MPDLPMQYQTSYEWQGQASEGNIKVESRHAFPVGTPHDTDRFCPEHLLVATAETCLANYVLLIAKLSRLNIISYESTAEGELEQTEDRKFRFKRIVIRPIITVDDTDDSLANKVVEKSHDACLIARSMNFPVDIEMTIIVEE
ncbi:MAG: OsmC family protein [Gammaproteobacteria bacterium]|nr:OsmC family protein [Gammaproteobacteria bacterium]